MRKEFLVFGAPKIEQAEIDEVVATLRSGWVGTGPRVAKFEKKFGEYNGAKHLVAVNSGSAALHLSLLASGIGPDDEVITTPLTFCATINSIIHTGAKPVLADIDPLTMNIDPDRIRTAISDKTKAILPVHFAGRPCDMNKILEIAKNHNLMIIEDCAHAIETEYRGRKAGTFGEFGCFSFYVTKNVITGEGGMVICRNESHSFRIKQLALHGMSSDAWKRFSDSGYRHYYVIEPGFKYNMMDIQAALGIHQLERVEANLIKREKVWSIYDQALGDLPITLPTSPDPKTRHARHLYTILVNEKVSGITRDQFLQKMTEMNIGVGVHYMSIPEHPFYQERYGWKPEDFPCAMRVGRTTVSLPLSAKLSEEDISDVTTAVRKILRSSG